VQEHRVYLVLDKITPQLRGFVSVLLVATGFVLQFSSKNILVGLPFIITCVILNLIRGVSIKQVHPLKYDWQEVTPEKIDQVLEHCKKIKKFQSGNVGCIITVFIIFIFGISFGAPLLHYIAKAPFPLLVAIINVVILFGGLALSGHKSAWMPSGLDIKTEIVKRLLDLPLIKKDPSLHPVPYLQIGKAKDGSLPNDARVLIKFKDAPSDFIGLQGQISINLVKSKQYPYFYVVLIAKPPFKLFEKFGKHSVDKVVIEQKETTEVDVIVIRQKTTKTSGYHTDTSVQDYILSHGITLAKALF
jgi:hypothetical protein